MVNMDLANYLYCGQLISYTSTHLQRPNSSMWQSGLELFNTYHSIQLDLRMKCHKELSL